MKTESKVKPKKYSIEERENGKVAVLFFTNIEEKIKDEEKIFAYDMYIFETQKQENLKQRIEKNYDTWLDFVKQQEIDKLSAEIRNTRDKMLADTDWTQMQDTALTTEKQKEYQVYRQALRDITKQENFPYNVIFPKEP